MRGARPEPQSGSGRIAIVTGASLSKNPRVLREGAALGARGFEVVVLGHSSNQASYDADRRLAAENGVAYRSVVAANSDKGAGSLTAGWRRLRLRAGRDLYRSLGIENRWQLGAVVPELAVQARAVGACYHIVHLEQGLWVGAKLLQAGRPVGIDMEDWYSEDLLPEARMTRPLRLLCELEGRVLRAARHATAPSAAMSEFFVKEFGCRAPAVVYNADCWSERTMIDGRVADRRNASIKSICWYSQTLGAGRGLEDLLAALPHLQRDVEIHLRGAPAQGALGWLWDRVPDQWRSRVFVHPVVPQRELLSRVAEHDIGFAGEVRSIRSRDLTVTNKILSYLLGGLAVIASDTKGQREVAAKAPGAIKLYRSSDPEALAAALNDLLEGADTLEQAKQAALRAAQSTFCWERQAPALVDVVTAALSERLAVVPDIRSAKF